MATRAAVFLRGNHAPCQSVGCVCVPPMSVCGTEGEARDSHQKGASPPHKTLGLYLNQCPSFPLGCYLKAILNQHETNPFQIVWINSRSVKILPWVLLPRFVEASFLTMPPPSGSAGNSTRRHLVPARRCTPRHPVPARRKALPMAWSPCTATAIKSGFILEFSFTCSL